MFQAFELQISSTKRFVSNPLLNSGPWMELNPLMGAICVRNWPGSERQVTNTTLTHIGPLTVLGSYLIHSLETSSGDQPAEHQACGNAAFKRS